MYVRIYFLNEPVAKAFRLAFHQEKWKELKKMSQLSAKIASYVRKSTRI